LHSITLFSHDYIVAVIKIGNGILRGLLIRFKLFNKIFLDNTFEIKNIHKVQLVYN
jgi:hypothetical protein